MEIAGEPQKVNWTEVIVFYVIACTISWPFFWWRDIEWQSWNALTVPGFVKTWSYMWGPGLSALICFWIFRKTHIKRVTFFGTSVIKSLVFYLLPLIALAIVGIPGNGNSVHMVPIQLATFGLLSILGEELGWRGYLQDALQPLPAFRRYVLIGVMWELWHFTNRMRGDHLLQIVVRVLIFMSVTTLLSYLFGKAVEKSRSLLVAVTLHAWVDILFEFNGPSTYVIFGVSIFFWIYMILNWEKKKIEIV
jgi:membrane protease YdiL (CAAX protease family)